MASTIKIHPAVDNGLSVEDPKFTGGTLKCKCTTNAITVKIDHQILHNHICGCTQCWKPRKADFAQIGVVPRSKVTVTANADKLEVLDPTKTILRTACVKCGVHMYGRIENKAHAFYGLDFIHVELSKEAGWAPPGFAAYVSSVIESGVNPKEMEGIRSHLRELKLEPYDCLNPALMDVIATNAAKISKVDVRSPKA